MVEIFTNIERAKILQLYEREVFQVPYIHSVLTGIQNGRLFANNGNDPTCAFICHDFGWSQIIGNMNEAFESDLFDFIFNQEAFSCFKVRAFSPNHAEFYRTFSEEAERCQFRLTVFEEGPKIPEEFSLKQIEPNNSKLLSDSFGLDLYSRNWPSKIAFHNNSFGFFVELENQPVSVCYASATNNDVLEIDVFTAPDYRGFGLAKVVCGSFIQECLNNNLIPCWDCFTNNEGSMNLARSLGFSIHFGPYPFYTYNRRK